MDAILALSQYGTGLAATKQTAHGIASALGRLLSTFQHAALERLILRQHEEVSSEFFRYPLP